jgi:hemoglobin-like flavoprotein
MNDFELVKASFERSDASNSFSDTFYDIFMSKSANIKFFFEKTNFIKQKKLLRATVKVLTTKEFNEPKAIKILGDIAKTHRRSGYGIEPKYYALWLDSLCETIALHDPEFTEDLEKKWRKLMQKPIDFIVARYET